MKTLIHIGDTPITLVSQDIDTELDIDKLLSIDYSNLYGEAVTVASLLNKIGTLRSLAEEQVSKKKLDTDIYEANKRKEWRTEADANGGKFTLKEDKVKLTEKSLDEAILLDETFVSLKQECLEMKKDFDVVDSWFWAIQDKSKKLNNILIPTTPAEFAESLIEGQVNTFIIKK